MRVFISVLLCVLSLTSGACTARRGPEPAPTPSEIRTPVGGGPTLRIAGSGVDNLDPALGYTTTSWFLSRGLFRTLVAYIPGDDGTPLLTGDLATSPGQPSEAGKRWTFELRPDLYYGPSLGDRAVPGVTGRPVECEDFKASLERVLDPGSGSAYPFYYEPIEGADAIRQGRADELSGLECRGPSTLVFSLERAIPDWPARLALPASAPFPRSVFEAEGGAERLPVTGPYYVETWEPARLIGLERNEWWEPSSDPVRRADPGRVRWRLDLTIEEAVERTRDGRLDLLVGASPRGRLLAGLVTDPRTSARLIAEPAGCLRFIFLNTEEPPFDRLVVREAVATALDRYMLNRLFGGPAAGDIATSIVPPGVPGHVPAAAFDPFPTTEWTGDLPTARRMLRRAGAEVLDEPIVLLGSESSPGREILGSVRGDLERLGFTNMKVETASGAELVEAFRSGDAHVGTEGSWCKDYEDAGTILRPLFHSSELASGSNFNLARLRDASLDGAIERAEGLPPGEERTAAWAGVNRDATELAAIIPWTWDRTTILHGPRLRNVRYLAPLTQVDWTNVRIRRTR